MSKLRSIPRTCDAQAVKVLVQLESERELGEQQGKELLSWLQETDFETDAFWVGELAARLIHDRGSVDLKSQVKASCSRANDWQLYFFLIALKDEVGWAALDGFIDSARQSKRSVIRAFADKLWQELHSPCCDSTETAEGDDSSDQKMKLVRRR